VNVLLLEVCMHDLAHIDAGSSVVAAGRYSMRCKGHAAFWRPAVELGLLDEEPVAVDGPAVDVPSAPFLEGLRARGVEVRTTGSDLRW
jgi:saccharopine dehydrogenase-like NADP-dependent oxidoreductase